MRYLYEEFFYHTDSSVKFQKTTAGSDPTQMLGLSPGDIQHLQSGQMVEEAHMMAAQNLIHAATVSSTVGISVNTSLSK